MKCCITNTILTFALGALAIAGVILVLRTVMQTRELQAVSIHAAGENAYLTQAQALFNEVTAYNQKSPSPELAKFLQAAQARPAVAK
jgi:hypothetical protein